MAKLGVLLALSLAGCAPCDEASCRAWCDAQEAPAVEMPERVVSADEARVLGDRLIEVRNGVLVVGDDGFGICRGTTRCEAFVGRGVRDPLPPGDYLIAARLHVPKDGAWPMDFVHWCEDDGSQGAPGKVVSFYEERRLDLRAPPGGAPLDLTPLAKLVTEPGNGRHCQYLLRPVGWSIRQDLFGAYPVHTR